MAQLPKRVAKLSADRRQLLERWLAGEAKAPPPSVDPEQGIADMGMPETIGSHKAECRQFYDEISRSLDASIFGPFSLFLNFGYVAAGGAPSYSMVQLPDECLNKNSMRLVLEVVGDCDLKDRRILDVGCGRGGTVSVIKQFFEPANVCGLDLAPAAIKFCRSNQRGQNLTFQVGDAERLAFPAESYDVITNVESSSTYPDVYAFYRQVFRVLAPGGHFLYADAMPVARFAECSAYLRRTGFTMELDRDITANVLASCGEIAGHRMQALGAESDGGMGDFLGIPGSQFYDEMKSGRWTYRIQRWKKPVPPAG
jgi:phthiocerol/phenolphthiocerol synthesis type-I polyketide synthase E